MPMNVVPRPTGALSITRITGSDGKLVTVKDAIRYGWLQLDSHLCPESYEDLGGPNLFVDTGRQLMAYLIGDKGPTSDYACKKFGVGTGTTPPRVTDVALASPLGFYGGGLVTLKPVDAVDFPAPFVVRVEFTLAAGEANGYLLTEMGLFSGNGILISRRVHAGINKTSDFAPTLGWRFRC
jgi:hypothetical protein